MWFGIVCCVIAIVLGFVMGHFAGRADLRDRLAEQDKEERDRASGALPYNYVSHKRRGEKK